MPQRRAVASIIDALPRRGDTSGAIDGLASNADACLTMSEHSTSVIPRELSDNLTDIGLERNHSMSAQRTAVVTGAGGGIGSAVVSRLAADGLYVFALDIQFASDAWSDDPNTDRIEKVALDIPSVGSGARPMSRV